MGGGGCSRYKWLSVGGMCCSDRPLPEAGGVSSPLFLWLGAKEVVLRGAQEALSYDSVGHCGERCSGSGTQYHTRKLQLAEECVCVAYVIEGQAGSSFTSVGTG